MLSSYSKYLIFHLEQSVGKRDPGLCEWGSTNLHNAWVNEWHADINRQVIMKVSTALAEPRCPVIKIVMLLDHSPGFTAGTPHAEIPDICRWVIAGLRIAAAKFWCCKANFTAMPDFSIRAQKALHPEIFQVVTEKK